MSRPCFSERVKGFEPSTLCLGSRCATTALHPHASYYSGLAAECKGWEMLWAVRPQVRAPASCPIREGDHSSRRRQNLTTLAPAATITVDRAPASEPAPGEQMLIVGTANTACGLSDGMAVLQRGGSVVDAVEAALRPVEDNRADDSVGLGGLPNLLGEVELDGCIMEGAERRAGAVASLQGYRYPISIARSVMEELPHVLLAGAGAARFAEEIGAERGQPDSPSSQAKYRERLQALGLSPEELHLPEANLRRALWSSVNWRPGGTANVIARDDAGHFCVGVTTSGWAYKYPGRVGDSPIIGAGGYADDRHGAAACTGLGEVAMRLCTSYGVVAGLAAGAALDDAVRAALEDVVSLPVGFPYGLNILAVDRHGNHTYWSTRGAQASYICMRDGDTEPRQLAGRGLPSDSIAP